MPAPAILKPVEGSSMTKVSTALTGLLERITYHSRLASTSNQGTTNGNDMTFKTPPATVIDVEGTIYKVVVIGKQIWMAIRRAE